MVKHNTKESMPKHGKDSLPLFKSRDKPWIGRMSMEIEHNLPKEEVDGLIKMCREINGRSLVDALLKKRITNGSPLYNAIAPILDLVEPFLAEGMRVHGVDCYNHPFKLFLAVSLVRFYNRR